MSRIGKQLLHIPEGVEVKIQDHVIIVKGPKGELKQSFTDEVMIKVEEGNVKVNIKDPEEVKQRALWGLFGALVKNMLIGVTQGFEKKLEINGVGFKAQIKGKAIEFELGFSHSINFPLPSGIEAKIEKNVITITGADKQVVGETAAQIRRMKKPEPYKGKGIKYIDEYIIRKVGKQAKGAE